LNHGHLFLFDRLVKTRLSRQVFPAKRPARMMPALIRETAGQKALRGSHSSFGSWIWLFQVRLCSKEHRFPLLLGECFGQFVPADWNMADWRPRFSLTKTRSMEGNVASDDQFVGTIGALTALNIDVALWLKAWTLKIW
jgi:hypothetical protein